MCRTTSRHNLSSTIMSTSYLFSSFPQETKISPESCRVSYSIRQSTSYHVLCIFTLQHRNQDISHKSPQHFTRPLPYQPLNHPLGLIQGGHHTATGGTKLDTKIPKIAKYKKKKKNTKRHMNDDQDPPR